MEATTQNTATSIPAESGKILEAINTETTHLKRLIRAVEHTIAEKLVTFSNENQGGIEVGYR